MLTINLKYPIILILVISIAFVAFNFSACKKGYEDRFGPFYIENDTTVFMDGDMGSRVDIQFEKLIKKYPNIKLVLFGDCPGSKDDQSMVDAATLLRNKGINTHLSANSIIESGAVDFFLAGIKRTGEDGSKIGVHAWDDGKKDATDYPVGDAEHQFYIDHYIFCGYSKDDAESLYYFIINAASPDDIHYMSDSEINKHKIFTQ